MLSNYLKDVQNDLGDINFCHQNKKEREKGRKRDR